MIRQWAGKGVLWGVAVMLIAAAVVSGVTLVEGNALVEQGAASAGRAEMAQDPLVVMYSAKFVCQAALPAGVQSYSPSVPLVNERTGVLIHNPNEYPVKVYKKAVRATLDGAPAAAPGAWKEVSIGADFAVRDDCDTIAQLLTGNPAATFIGTYGIGVEVEGFVVTGIGPQTLPDGTRGRYPPLDVSAEYERSSEVMKKDVNYQPWWTWWWYPLPWRLGYPYERIVAVDPSVNIDCRELLHQALQEDVNSTISDPIHKNITLEALMAGMEYRADSVQKISETNSPALVALIGRCDKIDRSAAAIDYLLVSNKGPTDPSPLGGELAQASAVRYPWLPGRWYDLAVVTPQNFSVDIDDYFLKWQRQRWIDAGEAANTVDTALPYYFPYWCGWGHWAWWWNQGDCTDIGVGEGESLDVEQVSPSRVLMSVWPPVIP